MNEFDADDPGHSARPNKSQLKRESQELEQLGITLSELPKEKLASIPMADKLREAIHAAQSITSFGALKRQRKFVGKLLRELDDTAPIREALAAFSRQSAQTIHQHHIIERWRDRILAEDDTAINAFLEDHPEADRQKLRQLSRDASKEREAERPPRSARLLFQYLRDCQESDPGDDAP